MAASTLSAPPAAAQDGEPDCRQSGLSPGSRTVVELRQAGEPPRIVDVFRDTAGQRWYLPLTRPARTPPSGPTPVRSPCHHEGKVLLEVAPSDPALHFSTETAVLDWIDMDTATASIDSRRRAPPTAQAVPALGLNYQLTGNWSNSRFTPSGLAEIYAYRQGWFFSTQLGLAPGTTTRYESYALKEDVDSSISLRLGDAVSSPTALGESVRFAGVAWGTDRTLQPGNFEPVLPTLRGGGVTASPVEVFINDQLRFQQTLQNGVFDLRNIPAQQGFNSYSVRTLDTLGNPVTVVREIYLPLSLLPAGITSWRVDAGWRRSDFSLGGSRYGGALLGAAYARGLSADATLSTTGFFSHEVTLAGADYSRRLSDLWVGQAGLHAGRSGDRRGAAVRLGVEGGGKYWQLFAEGLWSSRGLPGLAPDQPPLAGRRLLRAQFNGISNVSLGLTYAMTRRTGGVAERVTGLYASWRPFDTRMSIMFNANLVRSATGSSRALWLSLMVPLEPSPQSVASAQFSMNRLGAATLTRAQYNHGATDPEKPNWSVAANRDVQSGANSVDALWTGRTRFLELLATGNATPDYTSVQASVRSGVVWAAGSVFLTRPLTGAFAIVSTGIPNLPILHENRPVSLTDSHGVALVAGLRPYRPNRLGVNVADWPLEWSVAATEQSIVPPRGGGVLVSFRISTQSWPEETLLSVVMENGQPYPPGAIAYAEGMGREMSTVVNTRGQVWVGELLPARSFVIRHAGTTCEFNIPPIGPDTVLAPIRPLRCSRPA
ncbi:MAG: fimbrial biogenesis outer membrane usher protein [Ramlibacter sp.]|nr:fimbrial biogenesis outer membrane usher protein [Ramlibacter sp.]